MPSPSNYPTYTPPTSDFITSKSVYGQASAFRMHKKYPAGQQTPAQLAAERRNWILYSEKKYGKFPKTRAHKYKGFVHKTAKQRAEEAVRQRYNMTWLLKFHGHPIGVRYLTYHKKALLRTPTIGKNKKFVSRLAPGSYLTRTGWKKAKVHHFRKRIRHRASRMQHVKNWRHHGHRYSPK